MLVAGSRVEDKAVARREWEQAEAKLQLLIAGTRVEDKLIAKARLDEAQAKLDEFAVNLKEKTIYAPERAFVEVISVRPGDVVPANLPVIRALRAMDTWIKVYAPETVISKIRDARQGGCADRRLSRRRLQGQGCADRHDQRVHAS